jgi:hypothetical protein
MALVSALLLPLLLLLALSLSLSLLRSLRARSALSQIQNSSGKLKGYNKIQSTGAVCASKLQGVRCWLAKCSQHFRPPRFVCKPGAKKEKGQSAWGARVCALLAPQQTNASRKHTSHCIELRPARRMVHLRCPSRSSCHRSPCRRAGVGSFLCRRMGPARVGSGRQRCVAELD